MSSAGEGSSRAKTHRWVPFSFWKWTSAFLASYGVGHAVLVLLAGLALGLRVRSLLLPYLLLLWCGFVGASLIYWARQYYGQPKSGAIRFALAIFMFLNLYMGVLVFSAYDVNLLSQGEALFGYGPYILPTAALGSITVYFMARRRLEAFREHSAGAGS